MDRFLARPKAAPPTDVSEIRLAELLGALCHALDLTEGQPPGHCIRCCWIGVHIGEEIGLTKAEISDLYYTLLLKDLGCSSNASRICELFLTDDLTFKRDAKLVDTTFHQLAYFVLTHAGRNAGLVDRFRSLVNLAANRGELSREIVDTRCHRGAEIARQMRFSEAVADGIENLDEHWDGGGLPEGRKGTEIPLFSRIALMAQVVDVFQLDNGVESARSEIARRSGKWFDPQLVDAFAHVAARQAFWDGLRSPELQTAVLELEPALFTRPVDEDYLDEIAAAFAQVVDSKSPFTFGHSQRVSLFTGLIATEMGLAPKRRRWLSRAALLHDIGKLGVSNTILDKAGKPSPEEWQAIKRHPEYTEIILSRIAAFASMAEIAAAHHERLDGKGYPKGLRADQIAIETRIMTAADIFDALTADRPYRPAMPIASALAVMAESVGTAIDADCFAALQRVVDKTEVAAAA
jgi:HD-GYP domain-containing protein (c-di-GMP phosphodiesterase class II)